MSSFANPLESIANGKCGKDAEWYVIADTMHIGGTGFISTELAPIISKYKVKHVIIDHGITGIVSCAFFRCPDMDSLMIADSVTHIDGDAFFCSSIQKVYGVGEFGHAAAEKAICQMRWTFDLGRIIKNATLYIEDDNLEERLLHLDEGETSTWICGYLIDKLVIGKDVTKLPVEGLAERRSCSKNPPYSVVIHEENRNFLYQDGAIFSKDMRTLVFFNDIEREKYEIPYGVETIGKNAFENCSKLLSVVIPESVTKIEDSAFAGCVALSSVTLPEIVPQIGCDAFYEVPSTCVLGLDEYQDNQELDYKIGEPVFEHQKTINPDGSYAEHIIDPINKRGEIREYDAEGNFVRTVYFMSLY